MSPCGATWRHVSPCGAICRRVPPRVALCKVKFFFFYLISFNAYFIIWTHLSLFHLNFTITNKNELIYLNKINLISFNKDYWHCAIHLSILTINLLLGFPNNIRFFIYCLLFFNHFKVIAGDFLPFAKTTYRDNFILHQDNDPKHASFLCSKFLKTNGIIWSKAPSNSQD